MEEHLRPVDLARAVGVSVQTVRKYEAWGFLPAAERSASGYRRYTYRHLHALEAARTMIAGYGWQPALSVMQAVHRNDLEAALPVVDSRHAALDRGRREVEETLGALRAVSKAPEVQPGTRGRTGDQKLRVGEAAQRVGVRVSALRFWEEQGLLRPEREASSAYRLYDEEQMRRLQVIALLRQGGYGFEAIRTVLSELAAGHAAKALTAVEHRKKELAQASRRCAAATAALWAYVTELERCTE